MAKQTSMLSERKPVMTRELNREARVVKQKTLMIVGGTTFERVAVYGSKNAYVINHILEEFHKWSYIVVVITDTEDGCCEYKWTTGVSGKAVDYRGLRPIIEGEWKKLLDLNNFDPSNCSLCFAADINPKANLEEQSEAIFDLFSRSGADNSDIRRLSNHIKEEKRSSKKV